MITQTHLNWADWFIKHENYDAGNSNLQAFSDVLGSEVLTEAKIRDLVDEIDYFNRIRKRKHHATPFPQKFRWHKVPPQQQVWELEQQASFQI
jgi:hypothetical protein